MWTRRELKERAKDVLRTSYWKAFLVSFLLVIVTGGLPNFSFSGDLSELKGFGSIDTSPFQSVADGWNEQLNGYLAAFLIIFILIIGFAMLAGIAFAVFLAFPLEVGARHYFKQAAQAEVNMNYMGFAFAKGKYMAIVKTMFWRALLNFLWFLLLIVPGIVKSYAYSMVPYILADNPGIGRKRAIELSNQMTRGHKWNMFVLDLSFIGWYLLGMLALFVGVLFVMPYINSTYAELYLKLRKQAIDEGISSKWELNVSDIA